jgi:hypothetical protein
VDHYESREHTEPNCHDGTAQVKIGQNCRASDVGDTSYTRVCEPVYATVAAPVCNPITTTVDVPIMRTEHKSAPRDVTTTTVQVSVAGTWTVRRAGSVATGAFGGDRGATSSYAPPIGKVGASSTGTSTSLETLLGEVSPTGAIAIELARAFDTDVAEARRVAQAAAAAHQLDAEEEAWTRMYLLGGGEATTAWLGRYGARPDLKALFAGVNGHPVAVGALPEAKHFDLSGSSNNLTDREREALRARVVPTLSAKFWFQAELGYLGMGTVMSPQGEIGGDQGGYFGLRAGGRLFTKKAQDRAGIQFADEVSAVAAIGGTTNRPEGVVASGTFAANVAIQYILALGYRGVGGGGFFVGVRPGAGLFHFGSGMPTYANVLGFARLELSRVGGAVALEAIGGTLAGTQEVGVALHIGKGSVDWKTLGVFFSLRVEQITTSTGLKIPVQTDPFMDSPEIDVDGVTATAVSALIGVSM